MVISLYLLVVKTFYSTIHYLQSTAIWVQILPDMGKFDKQVEK